MDKLSHDIRVCDLAERHVLLLRQFSRAPLFQALSLLSFSHASFLVHSLFRAIGLSTLQFSARLHLRSAAVFLSPKPRCISSTQLIVTKHSTANTRCLIGDHSISYATQLHRNCPRAVTGIASVANLKLPAYSRPPYISSWRQWQIFLRNFSNRIPSCTVITYKATSK